MEEEGRAGGLNALWGLMIPCPKELAPTCGSAFQCLGGASSATHQSGPMEPCGALSPSGSVRVEGEGWVGSAQLGSASSFGTSVPLPASPGPPQGLSHALLDSPSGAILNGCRKAHGWGKAGREESRGRTLWAVSHSPSARTTSRLSPAGIPALPFLFLARGTLWSGGTTNAGWVGLCQGRRRRAQRGDSGQVRCSCSLGESVPSRLLWEGRRQVSPLHHQVALQQSRAPQEAGAEGRRAGGW